MLISYVSTSISIWQTPLAWPFSLNFLSETVYIDGQILRTSFEKKTPSQRVCSKYYLEHQKKQHKILRTSPTYILRTLQGYPAGNTLDIIYIHKCSKYLSPRDIKVQVIVCRYVYFTCILLIYLYDYMYICIHKCI